MKRQVVVLFVVVILFVGLMPMQNAFAQVGAVTGGIKDNPGTWYVGEGLKKGDYFSYEVCHVDFQECRNFELDIWVEGDVSVGSEEKWLVRAVVYDGSFVITGTMELGKVAPEPTGGTPELSKYRGAFKTSIVWLSAFANANEPKQFNKPSWGKIANIGGEQIIPTEMQTISVPAGTYETALITWKTGGQTSKVWVLDGFPFPIKAETWTHVSEGIPPPEYRFKLLDYKENVPNNPFANVVPNFPGAIKEGCPKTIDLKSVKHSTKNFSYLLHVKYGPETPTSGCQITWFINFLNQFDETEFLNQVQYDILVVDDNLKPLRSIAGEEGQNFLYSPSGQVHRTTVVKEDAGIAHYVIWIYGLAPEYVVPSEAPDYLQIDIPITGSTPGVPPSIPPPPPSSSSVPSWIKTTAGFWVDGFSSDGEFVNAIQFLINEGVIVIPPTVSGQSTGTEIPSWIKTTTGFWVDGFSSDKEFVSAIQWLIENGIMRIA